MPVIPNLQLGFVLFFRFGSAGTKLKVSLFGATAAQWVQSLLPSILQPWDKAIN